MIFNELSNGIYNFKGNLATINLNPTKKVYNEKLVDYEDKEFRLWDARRSKLAAAILNGLEGFQLSEKSKILYLGASAGTTPSHLSDIVYNGYIYCIEFSARMMRELLYLSRERENLIPILDDASKPHHYRPLISEVDHVYCDVAQPNQTEIFMSNMRMYLKEDSQGIIMLKARSIDVTQNPKKIFRQEESKLKQSGFKILEKINLEPYEKDHRALLCQIVF
jgi:fibrillarin-like pre-rRNA processing protein